MIENYKIATSFPVIARPEYLESGGHVEQGYVMLRRDKIFLCCPALRDAHALLLESDPIGRIGNYRGVYELGLGLEAYTPDVGSNPGHGVVGIEELIRTITFVTYCDINATSYDYIVKFIEQLAKIHPWEHPVIKLYAHGITKLYGGK
jgi:hypothetical protein